MSWAEAALLLPFVLVVPGFAIAAALFPPGTLDRSDRVVYSFVFSISAAALGGLALQVAIGLSAGAWMGLLLAIALGAGIVAVRRGGLPFAPWPSLRIEPGGALSALALLAALALAGGSIAIAARGVRDQQAAQAFASLWATPVKVTRSSTVRTAPLSVGVWNHGGPSSYRLSVSSHGREIESLPVRVGPDQRWQRTLPPPVTAQTGSLSITLYRGSSLYRKLKLNIGEG